MKEKNKIIEKDILKALERPQLLFSSQQAPQSPQPTTRLTSAMQQASSSQRGITKYKKGARTYLHRFTAKQGWRRRRK